MPQNAESKLPVSRLIHAAVRNRSGARLGRIDELLIDATDGRIEYALLTVSCGAAPARRRVAVPWSALQWPPAQDHVVLDASPATLRSLRSYA